MKTITGTWNYPDGTPVANGTLYLKLSQDAVATNTAQIAPRVLAITLNASGQIPANTQVWASDELSPLGTFYRCSVVAVGGALVWGEDDFSITGASPINLNSLVPVVSAGSPIYSQLSPILLQTNGINNGSQNKLNLVPGANVTIVDDGVGDVTVGATVNGVAAGGSLTVVSNTNITGAVGSTAVNVTTEGTKDWYVFNGGSFGDFGNFSTATGQHFKALGGWIKNSFRFWGASGTYAAAQSATSVFAMTSTIGDDGQIGATQNNNFLNAQPSYMRCTTNGVVTLFSNWGFLFQAPADHLVRTLNIYYSFSSGSTAANNTLVFTFHLGDLSATDVTFTLSPAATGEKFYKMVVTFNSYTGGVPLFVKANVVQNTADGTTTLGFQGATLA